MSLGLPKKISPDPLLSSTVELRFTSDLSSEETLTLLRPKYMGEFPKLSKRDIATQKNDRPELEYIAEYVLSGTDYHIFLDKNVIAFENIGAYHLWDSYYTLIQEKLKVLADTIPIKSIQRIGLRYVRFFPTTDEFSEVLKFNFNAPIEGYTLENELFRTLLCRDDIKILLNLAKNAQIERNNNVVKGVVIDIDVSQEGKLPSSIGYELFDIIDQLHTQEKIFFFSLLREDFLEKMTIDY